MKFQCHNLDEAFVIVADRAFAQELSKVCIPDSEKAIRALGERIKALDKKLQSLKVNNNTGETDYDI